MRPGRREERAMIYPESGKAWDFLRSAKDDDIPLGWAAVMVARDEYPDIDVAGYEALFSDYGERVRHLIARDGGPVDTVRALNGFMFDEMGFTGNQQDYYDPRNSYINEVVERRLGIPISLAVVQLDIAQRIGLPLRGVSFPGHFLVSLPVDGGILVLDPYHRGRSVDAQELKNRALPHVGNNEDIPDDELSTLLAPASNRAILARMLRNLKALYAEKEDWERALRCTDRLLAVDSSQPGELRDRGMMYLRVGHVHAAREDITRYLSLQPSAEDADQMREVLIQNSRGGARLN
jgi:regulator of sirC expression with transglutaminase-like and TPR domain